MCFGGKGGLKEDLGEFYGIWWVVFGVWVKNSFLEMWCTSNIKEGGRIWSCIVLVLFQWKMAETIT